MTDKLRWAVVGAGGIADRRMIPAILKDEGSALAAIMDRDGNTAAGLGKKYGVPFFTSEKEMLEAIDCDAVYIGTPVAFHGEQALLALGYGKHVLTEKPITVGSDEGDRLVDAFEAAGKQLAVGYMMPYHDLHIRARKLTEEGRIGAVNSVSARFSCWYPPIAGAWRQRKALGGGGAFMDLGVHCIDLIEYLLNDEIADVKSFCASQTFDYEVEDGAVMIFATRAGVIGCIHANFNVPDDASESRLELYGDKGCIILDGTLGQEEKGTLSHLYAPQSDYTAMQERKRALPSVVTAGGADLYLKRLKAFRSAVSSGVTDLSDARRAAHVQRIVESVYEDSQKSYIRRV